MNDIDVVKEFAYHNYIMKVINRYDSNLISDQKFNQHLATLDKWESRYNRMSLAKKEELRFVLGHLN